MDLQTLASTLILAVAGSAGWGYFKDRRKSKAEGQVATATVEIQVEAARVQGLEQRFAFAQRAWDEERESLTRRIGTLERDLAEERHERDAEKTLHEEKVGLLEERVRGMQRMLNEVTEELATLRTDKRDGPAG